MRAKQRATQVYAVHKHRPFDIMVTLGIEAVTGELNQEEMLMFRSHLRWLADRDNALQRVRVVQPDWYMPSLTQASHRAVRINNQVRYKRFTVTEITYCKYSNAVMVKNGSEHFILSRSLLSAPTESDRVTVYDFDSQTVYTAGISNALVCSDNPCSICMEYSPHHKCTTPNCSGVYCDKCFHKLGAYQNNDLCPYCRKPLIAESKLVANQNG